MAGETAAAMQRNHRRERAVTIGPVELRMQCDIAFGNLDLAWGRKRRRSRGRQGKHREADEN